MTLEDERTEIETDTASVGRELVPVPVHEPSLGDLAASINHCLDMITKSENAAGRHRLRAGQYLVEAREHVPPGEWIAWCKDNIKRSYRDIKRLMKIAGAEDPEAALAQERAKARESMARTRGTNVCPPDSDLKTPPELFASIRPTLDSWSVEAADEFAIMLSDYLLGRPDYRDRAVATTTAVVDEVVAKPADPEPELDRSSPWNHPLPDDEAEAPPTDPAPVDPVDNIAGDDDAKAPEADQPEVEPIRSRCAPRVTPASYARMAETKPVSAFNDDKLSADIAKAYAEAKKRTAAEKRRAKKGRTLTPAEIAAEASKLGFPVSQKAA